MTTYSFIIPHHNCPELLNRCLDSIPQREDIQVIVVDDNSETDKKPVIKRAGVELYTIGPQESLGAGHARNVGLAKAVGEWVLFADADDFYLEELLEEIDRFKNSDVDVIYFNYARREADSFTTIEDNDLQRKIDGYNGDKEVADYIRFCNNTPTTKMIRLKYIKSHAMFFEEVPNGNDVLFSLFVGSYTEKFAVTRARLYAYMNNPNSIGTKKQTNSGILCRWIHRVQHNCFNRYIGYPHWNIPVGRVVLRYMKQSGFVRGVWLLMLFWAQFVKRRGLKTQWVELIKGHQQCEF